MRIIIEIPESEIPKQQDVIEIPFHFIDGTVCEVGGYGFDVLPKGHGKLKDADAICKDIISALGIRDENYLLEAEEAIYKRIKNAPTIIEADKESEE